VDQLVGSLQKAMTQVHTKEPAWAQSSRQEAFARFTKNGLPTRRSEDWRYTDLSSLKDREFSIAPSDFSVPLDYYLLSVPAPRIVFLNGLFSAKHSDFGKAIKGLQIGSLSDAISKDGERLKDVLGERVKDDFILDLNEALARDGAFIELKDGVSAGSPIFIVNLASGSEVSSQINLPRHVIRLGKNSKASITEAYAHVNAASYWTHASTSIELAEGAVLDHYKIQNENQDAYHLGSCRVRQLTQSTYNSFSFSVGAKVGRNNLLVSLAGSQSLVTLNGLYLTKSGQLLDNHTIVDHLAPEASSHQYYKGILSEHSRAVFNGKIVVRRDAQKTDSSQLNKNLLLGPMAEIDTRPQLQIDADDVKCNHGASIGRMNPEELFYLESRGLNQKQATQLLCHGFAEDLILRIEDQQIRHEINNLLAEAFVRMKVNV
jgi:Fe-S cluster assembly protein SufD